MNTAPTTQIEVVQEAVQYIDQNWEATPTLDDLSQHINVSPYHLQRVFKKVMGITPKQYAEARRVNALKEKLREFNNVTDAMYDVGYGSSSRLYESAPGKLGMTPATYQKGGAGVEIRYAMVEIPLGVMLVASTERGIASICLGDDAEELERCLFEEYPAATITHDQHAFCDWVIDIITRLNGWRPHLQLPLDARATAFRWRVWTELMKIPYGQTKTYGEIAAALGQPNAAQAVAKACSENPLSIVIPCHRAGRQDGTASSYYDEEARFRRDRLLEFERQNCKEPQ